MVGANLKAETMAMMESRTAVEAEMDAIIARLSRPGGAGLQGNLVDSEGFPRADLDIAAVRADRQRLSVLRNDHKELTSSIERNIYILHSGGFTKDSTLPQKPEVEDMRRSQRVGPIATPSGTHNRGLEGPSPMDEDAGHASVPFAVFDEVTEGSPGALDGILLGDQLTKFGSVEGGENVLQHLARESQLNEGSGLNVVVLRRGEPIHLVVTPRRWAGHGLLGCHIQPL
ncbi:unnamed protein product [Sphagnum compactum]